MNVHVRKLSMYLLIYSAFSAKIFITSSSAKILITLSRKMQYAIGLYNSKVMLRGTEQTVIELHVLSDLRATMNTIVRTKATLS